MNFLTFDLAFKQFPGGPETDDQQRLRFQVELEFVQCLANPNYLNCKYTIYLIKDILILVEKRPRSLFQISVRSNSEDTTSQLCFQLKIQDESV